MHVLAKLQNLFEKVDDIAGKRRMNLARKKFMSLFIDGLIRIRNVHFTEIAAAMSTEVQSSSNHRRIQDFFANYELDYLQLSIMLYCMLPRWGKLTLSIDRTNWSYGQTDINFLVITAYCEGVGIPLWFELLKGGKGGGNSNQEERMEVIRYCVKLFGRSRKLVLCGDREFIGEAWISWLLEHEIDFFLRTRKNTRIVYQSQDRAAWQWLEHFDQREMDNCQIGTHWLSVGIKKLPGGKAEDEYLIVLTNTFASRAIKAYKKRWSIEVFFQSIKERGFRLENTHLRDENRLRKLFALVSIAFAICLKLGIYAHRHIKTIPTKNHGYKANSFFRHGLDICREALKLGTNLDLFIRILEQAWTQKIPLKLSP